MILKLSVYWREWCVCSLVIGAMASSMGCTSLNDNRLDVGFMHPQTGKPALFMERLKPSFENGVQVTEVSIEKFDDKYYLLRQGKDSRGNCHNTATPVDVTPNGSIVYMVRGIGSGGLNETNSCTGNPCSSCNYWTYPVFTCACRDAGSPPGKCNHTVTVPSKVFNYIE